MQDLLATGRMLPVKGQAYTQQDQVGSWLVCHVQASVARSLALSARKWASNTTTAEAGCLAPIVELLAIRYLGTDYGGRYATALSARAVWWRRCRRRAPCSGHSCCMCMALMTHWRADHH